MRCALLLVLLLSLLALVLCVLQMLALVPRSNQACRALMARWLIAFCRASKWYIREDEPLAKELTPWLEPNELQQLVRELMGGPHPVPVGGMGCMICTHVPFAPGWYMTASALVV